MLSNNIFLFPFLTLCSKKVIFKIGIADAIDLINDRVSFTSALFSFAACMRVLSLIRAIVSSAKRIIQKVSKSTNAHALLTADIFCVGARAVPYCVLSDCHSVDLGERSAFSSTKRFIFSAA